MRVNNKTHSNQKPFFFGGSQVPFLLDLQPNQFHGTGLRKDANKVVSKAKKIIQQKGKTLKKPKMYKMTN